MASVSIGRSRFPPEEIRWLATSGIIVTSEPVRDRMAALTRAMSAATSAIRASMDAPEGLSKGTITATRVSSFAMVETTIGTAASRGKCSLLLTRLRHCRVMALDAWVLGLCFWTLFWDFVLGLCFGSWLWDGEAICENWFGPTI